MASEEDKRRARPLREWQVLSVLSLLLGFPSISTDLYLPAMPEMAISLKGTDSSIAWTVSGFLVGFSLGQLFWGPAGDRLGRRLPIAIGIVLFILSSVGCALSDSVAAVIGWRLLQGVGASACVVLSRAAVRDLYEGSRAAQMMATLMTVMAIAPLIGPAIGGQVLAIGDWRLIFWLLAAIGMMALGALYTLPESLPAERRNTTGLSDVLADYRMLMRNRRLVGFAAAGGFFYAGIFACIAGTPFAFINYHHVSPQVFGVLFGLSVLGVIATTILNKRLLPRFGTQVLLVAGALLAMVSAGAVAFTASTDAGGLWGLLLPLLLFIAATGLIVPNSISGALADFPERAGAVSAFVGALQYGSGIVGSGMVGVFADGTPVPLGWIVAGSGAGSLLSTVLFSRRGSIRSPG